MKTNFNRSTTLITIAVVLSLGLGACQDDTEPSTQDVANEFPQARVGLEGEYDSSGLAKRVLKAIREDPQLAEVTTVYVAQRGSTIVLKGTVSDVDTLNRIVDVAQGVDGTDRVDSQVQVL